MGRAERLNPKSMWNQRRNKNIVQVSTPKPGEPTAYELSLKNCLMFLKDLACRMFSPARTRPPQSPAPTS